MSLRNSPLQNSKTPSLLLSLVLIVCACQSRAGETPKVWDEFSGEKAFAQVQRLVDFGPRPAGSKAVEKSRDYIEDQLRRSGWQVTRQAFSDDSPQGKIQFVHAGQYVSPSALEKDIRRYVQG